MENQKGPTQASSDEIDLKQLILMIKNGLNSIFKRFLRVFVYFKKNFVILAGLVIVGAILGYALKFISSSNYKTEAIVRPNFESKEYVQNTIEEIDANIRRKDTLFFKSIGLNISDLEGFNITIEPLSNSEFKASTEEDVKYLDLLESFKNQNFVVEAVKEEILRKSETNQRITFTYKDVTSGNLVARKVLNYLNRSSYFNEIKDVRRDNIKSRIKKDSSLIIQIDGLIEDYSKAIAKPGNLSTEGTVYLDSEKGIDISDLLALKNNLTREIESKRVELVQTKEVISIINFGNTQVVKDTFLGNKIVLVPLVLLTLFLLFGFVKFLNKKAEELG